MEKTKNKLVPIVEKVLDPNIKLGILSILGFTVPSSLSEIGLTGGVVAGWGLASSLKSDQFERDFERFTNELNQISEDQKLRFFNKYSAKDIQSFGEQALMLLNKIEMPLAAKMLGKAHYLLVLDEIDEDEYYNYCHVIKNINSYLYKNIQFIFNDEHSKRHKGGVYAMLESLGLMVEAEQKAYLGAEILPTKEYICSDFGIKFYGKII